MRKASVGIHLYDFNGNKCSRMVRITNTLLQAKIYDECHVIYLKSSPHFKPLEMSDNIQVYRFGGKSTNSQQYLSKLGNLLIYYLKSSCHILSLRGAELIITAHSLNVLPLAVLVSKMCKVKLVYAPHELESERGGQPVSVRFARRFIEKIFIRSCNHTIVVNQTIANWYRQTYGDSGRIDYIYNYPDYPINFFLPKDNSLRQALKIDKQKTLLVTHGIITEGRGLINLMEATSRLPTDKFHLLIIGEGKLRKKLEAYKLENVTFWNFQSVPDLLKTIHDSDIGLVLMEKAWGLSYEFSSPNKLFECLASGIFVISTDLPEAKSFLKRESNTILISDVSVPQLILAINDASKLVKSTSYECAPRKNFHWDSQVSKLVNIYQEVTNVCK